MSAFDNARYVSEGDLGEIFELKRPDNRVQRGKGVSGDPGAGVAQGGEQRRLTGIGEADKAEIGYNLKFDPHAQFDARVAWRKLLRYLMRRAFPMHIAEATFAAARDDDLLAIVHDIAKQLARYIVVNGGTAGNINDQIGTVASMHLLPAPWSARLSDQMGAVEEPDQRIFVGVAAEDYMTAAPAIAAIGAPALNMRLTAKTSRPIATASRPNLDGNTIDELTGFHGSQVKRI
jgi:hypothetical protein